MNEEQKILNSKAKDLANGIREWVKSQLEIWHEIPRYAGKAAASSYSNQHRMAHEDSLWCPNPLEAGDRVLLDFPPMVDLKTGDLWTDYAKVRMASDAAVLTIAGMLELYNASEILKKLKEYISQPLSF